MSKIDFWVCGVKRTRFDGMQEEDKSICNINEDIYGLQQPELEYELCKSNYI